MGELKQGGNPQRENHICEFPARLSQSDRHPAIETQIIFE